MWRLPDGRTIMRPKSFVSEGTQYMADIFFRWSREKLASVGVKEVQEESFDKRFYRATSWTEEEVDGMIIRSPVLEAIENKSTPFPEPTKKVLELPTSNLEIIDAGQDAGTEEVWVKIRVGGTIAYLRGYLTK